MKAMILAAGEGTRLRPFTMTLPKPAIPFLGVPLADYGIHLLDEIGRPDLVVNLYHLPNEVRRLFARPVLRDRKIDFSDETLGLLGSGGGLHKAKDFLSSEPHFVAVNGDEVILPHAEGQIRAAYQNHVESGRLATIVATQNPEVGTKFGGVWCDETLRVVRFSKTAVSGLTGWHYAGIVFYSQRLFSYFKSTLVEENILYETLTSAMTKNETVAVFPIRAEWYETGNPTDFKAATAACLDALTSSAPPPWAVLLRDFLRAQTPIAPLVEKDDPLLAHRLAKLQDSLRRP